MDKVNHKVLQCLINSGFKLKETHETADGSIHVFSQDGKRYRLFVTEDRPVPVKLVRETLQYVD